MHPVTLPSLRCYSWGHLSRFWNVLGILFPESCFPSRVPEHSSLVNSSGDVVNPGPSCLLGDFQVVVPAVRDLFKLLSRACLPGAGFQSADCPAVGLDWLLRSWRGAVSLGGSQKPACVQAGFFNKKMELLLFLGRRFAEFIFFQYM